MIFVLDAVRSIDTNQSRLRNMFLVFKLQMLIRLLCDRFTDLFMLSVAYLLGEQNGENIVFKRIEMPHHIFKF